MAELLKNSKYEIWTDSGWSDFDGLMIKGEQPIVCVELDDGSRIECTPDHEIFTEAMISVEARLLTSQHTVITESGTSKVKHVGESITQRVYDIHNVHKNNRFYSDGMLVSNCEFVIYDETLIDAIKLMEMTGSEPAYTQGQVRWYRKPDPTGMYVVALDPCAGTGGDYAGIQVLEANTMEQVAEWQHNKTPVEGQIKTMMNIMQYLRDMGAYQIYWSVENNTIGEAALVVIRDTGEENFPGEFLTEPRKSRGSGGGRKGFTTTKRSKNDACIQFKRFVENGKMRLHSKRLLSELKNFVAYSDTYRAKPGEHDDLVMSMILVIRMIDYIATFEDSVYNNINSGLKYDDFLSDDDDPLPVMF